MQTISRKIGAFDDLLFTVDLSGYGKTISDIDDVFFSIKSNLTDNDDLLFLKQQTVNNGIVVTGSDTNVQLAVSWDYDEYDNFTAGEDYKAGIFIKFTIPLYSN